MAAFDIRRLTGQDLDACLDLAADRSWPREPAKWRLLLELGGGYGIDDPDGGLAGTVMLTEVAPRIAAVGMLLVAGRHGGRGLGRRLMTEALGAGDYETVFLYATPAGRPLYDKLGFRVVDEVVAHIGLFGRTGPLPPDVRDAGPGDLATLNRLDRQAFGAGRAGLLRHLPVFADRIVLASGGYAAAWRSDDLVYVGPVIADSVGTARVLLEHILPEGRRTRVDLHSDVDGLLGDWLTERGLVPRPPAPLMVLGKDLPGDRATLWSPMMQAIG